LSGRPTQEDEVRPAPLGPPIFRPVPARGAFVVSGPIRPALQWTV
jgi:hypothetical protein